MSEPDPNKLLSAADEEPQKFRGLRAYRPVIRKLKDEKRFTFREIAEWLQERGLTIDHNGVYRQYTAGMDSNQAEGEEIMDDEMERESEIEDL